MIRVSLQVFVDRVLDNRRLDRDDVRCLQNDILSEGLSCREEADVLIALDRALPTADPAYAEFLVATLVDHVVWASRPTGYVDAETARWLVTSLTCGIGPTPTADRLAFEIVREAQQVDEVLLAFVMSRKTRRAAPALDLAA